MRFSYGVPMSCPLNPAFTTAPALSALAQQAEEAGFECRLRDGTSGPEPALARGRWS